MLHIALYRPEIPPNTGNIIRLCANSGAMLHLIHPLGFSVDDKQLKRAGLDYHEWARVQHYDNVDDFLTAQLNRRIFVCTTHATQNHCEPTYQDEDLFLFGQETKGLPETLRTQFLGIRIPMLATSRSLNLSNAVAIILYEGLRQVGFPK